MSDLNDLLPGAKNAVQVCMGVKKTDRVLIFTDKITENIGKAHETLLVAPERRDYKKRESIIYQVFVRSNPIGRANKQVNIAQAAGRGVAVNIPHVGKAFK